MEELMAKLKEDLIKGRKQVATREDIVVNVVKEEVKVKKHIKSVHSDERPFQCEEPGCDKKLANGNILNMHTRSINLPDTAGMSGGTYAPLNI